MNATDLVLKLKKTAHDPSLVYFREMTLKPHTQHTISVKFDNGIKGGDCNFEVTDFIVAPIKVWITPSNYKVPAIKAM